MQATSKIGVSLWKGKEMFRIGLGLFAAGIAAWVVRTLFFHQVNALTSGVFLFIGGALMLAGVFVMFAAYAEWDKRMEGS